MTLFNLGVVYQTELPPDTAFLNTLSPTPHPALTPSEENTIERKHPARLASQKVLIFWGPLDALNPTPLSMLKEDPIYLPAGGSELWTSVPGEGQGSERGAKVWKDMAVSGVTTLGRTLPG